jgi:hypothetical protein
LASISSFTSRASAVAAADDASKITVGIRSFASAADRRADEPAAAADPDGAGEAALEAYNEEELEDEVLDLDEADGMAA